MDFVSLWLRALGALLILIGLFGSGAGIYAIILVGSYSEQVEPGALDVKTGLTDLSSTLKNRRAELESSIDEASGGLDSASSGIEHAGDEVLSASVSVDMASRNLTTASSAMSMSADLDKEAGTYLKSASEGLELWADNYEYNGTPLPDKELFKSAAENMSKASEKLTESGEKSDAAAENVGETASHLQDTASELKGTSDELRSVGDKLDETGAGISKIKGPLGSLIADIIVPLESSARGTKLINDVASNTKNSAYLVLGYFVLIHFIFIGLGIALIILEVNLSYSM